MFGESIEIRQIPLGQHSDAGSKPKLVAKTYGHYQGPEHPHENNRPPGKSQIRRTLRRGEITLDLAPYIVHNRIKACHAEQIKRPQHDGDQAGRNDDGECRPEIEIVDELMLSGMDTISRH